MPGTRKDELGLNRFMGSCGCLWAKVVAGLWQQFTRNFPFPGDPGQTVSEQSLSLSRSTAIGSQKEFWGNTPGKHSVPCCSGRKERFLEIASMSDDQEAAETQNEEVDAPVGDQENAGLEQLQEEVRVEGDAERDAIQEGDEQGDGEAGESLVENEESGQAAEDQDAGGEGEQRDSADASDTEEFLDGTQLNPAVAWIRKYMRKCTYI